MLSFSRIRLIGIYVNNQYLQTYYTLSYLLRQLLLLSCLFSSQLCWGQVEEDEKSAVILDSLIASKGQYVPAFSLSLKTQYPIQHAIGLEFMTRGKVSGYIGLGQLSRAYVATATELLPDQNANQEARKQFIQEELRNGFVFELGTHYHILKWRDVYVGLNLQFQRFSMVSTPQELVEEFDFGNSQGFAEDLQEAVETNDLIRYFYEDTKVKAVLNPIQLGFTMGKRFRFKRRPRWSIHTEFSYQINLASRARLDSDDFIGQLIVNNFINPILDEGTEDSFGSFNLPSISIRLSYSPGEYVFRRKGH
ncbi:MAG: hypothetical protein AAF824_01695 [Bacteroidota bacterium]